MNEPTTTDIEPNALAVIERTQIDMQIATAKQYPRNISKVKLAMTEFACLDEETASSCFYTLPRGGKVIQGPSVRLGEIALSCYQNVKAGTRILEQRTTGDNPHVIVQAVCLDLQNNVSVSIEKRRRILKKKTKNVIDDDDINLAVNSCSAIAIRDAIFKIVPQALIKPVYEAAKRVAIGEAKSIAAKRAKVLERLQQMGVTQVRIFEFLGVTKVDEIGIDRMEILIGLGTAIKDGETTIEEAFGMSTAPKQPDAPEAKPEAKESTPEKEPDPAPESPVDDGDLGPVTKQASSTLVAYTPQAELEKWMSEASVSFEDFASYLRTTKICVNELLGFNDVPDDICEQVKEDNWKLAKKIAKIFGSKKA